MNSAVVTHRSHLLVPDALTRSPKKPGLPPVTSLAPDQVGAAVPRPPAPPPHRPPPAAVGEATRSHFFFTATHRQPLQPPPNRAQPAGRGGNEAAPLSLL